jgi:hypothetical protein
VASCLVLIVSFALFDGAGPLDAQAVTGTVRDEAGPVAGATVRIQATTGETRTDGAGRFSLGGLTSGATVTVSAWKHGYYCAKVDAVVAPADGLLLELRRYQTNDNPAYQWVPPTGPGSCASCKAGVTQVWLDNDAHARSAVNQRFLTMYRGTDVAGNASPPTRYIYIQDYGRVPLPPDPTSPYFGPGYKLDFPATAGNCAACHTPGDAIASPYGTDPTAVPTENNLGGVHCDFCHKVADVRLDAATGLPASNMPGVLSMDIRRPFPEDPHRYQLFFGTFDDDNVPEEDTALPLLRESAYCAPCHLAVFWDVTVYDSFGEWLRSPYSQAETGKTCQQCHMPAPTLLAGHEIGNVAPGFGGVQRDPLTIHAHTFPGAASLDLLRNAVSLTAAARVTGERLTVDVSVTNDRTGHHVPTDSPLRHMILLVEARDGLGRVLQQVEGPVVPTWGGVGDPADGYYAGLPGKAFAKVLEELWTGVSPTGAYWNHTRLVSDNRLEAFATDRSAYIFAAPPAGQLLVRVTLLFRRAYKALSDQKGWLDPDIEMGRQDIALRPARVVRRRLGSR